jgi:hypothetical protein
MNWNKWLSIEYIGRVAQAVKQILSFSIYTQNVINNYFDDVNKEALPMLKYKSEFT